MTAETVSTTPEANASEVGTDDVKGPFSSAGVRCPTHFGYWEAKETPTWKKRERLAKKVFRHQLFPDDDKAQLLCEDLFAGDPVAERFVAEVFFGEIGPKKGRQMLMQALEEGVDAVEGAPDSMKELFAEFESVPDWVDVELVKKGAEVWRRWGTMLFSVAGAITLEIYTEGAVAKPLALAGGYAGDNALRRFLETSQFWIDMSEPGKILEPGSSARTTAMLVRVMHVSVRKRVGEHPEWDHDAYGLPISQTYEQMTQIGGAVAPALSLWLAGVHTTPSEMRALIHFNRYMGHLVGVQPRWATHTIRDQLQVLAMATAARTYDAGDAGKELIESFPAAFAPRPGQRGLRRLRAWYNHRIYAAYCALWMAPPTRRMYDMPSAAFGLGVIVLRLPFLHTVEILRRLPGLKQLHVKVVDRHRRNWLEAQMNGRKAAFDASSGLRK
ncbi:oxygenase MpaB family protein [Aeromicrobium sp. Root495]|uniref:oxygenase MpaB family protein n=1 Tax=Aeromicrobium sp. Root495 TaxID=1736550 RepID=UPI000B065D01|nr:oxygenase MpaB family protein [Aeromicrobium sp. Root495]